MLNTTRSLWASSAFAGVVLVGFACSSGSVDGEGQALEPATSAGSVTTGGSALDASSSVGGATSGTVGTTTGGGNPGDSSSSASVTTTSPATTSSSTGDATTTGGLPATTTGEASTTAAGGTSSVTPPLTTTNGAGGVTGSTESSTTDTGSSAAGGTAGVIDDPECEEFCDLFFAACADEVADSFFSDQLYPDHASCMAACVTFQKGGTYGSDTLGCRRAHIVDNPDGGVHCVHASESGGGQCPPEQ